MLSAVSGVSLCPKYHIDIAQVIGTPMSLHRLRDLHKQVQRRYSIYLTLCRSRTHRYTQNSKCGGPTKLVYLWNWWSCSMSMLSPERVAVLVKVLRKRKERKEGKENVEKLHCTVTPVLNFKTSWVFWCWTRVLAAFLVGPEISNASCKTIYIFSHI